MSEPKFYIITECCHGRPEEQETLRGLIAGSPKEALAKYLEKYWTEEPSCTKKFHIMAVRRSAIATVEVDITPQEPLKDRIKIGIIRDVDKSIEKSNPVDDNEDGDYF